ncbi:SGT1-like protein A [Colletotrichum chlorophyti]|uniref:SGT1-like protein A n=1 Tax=Colletotrichum chlorophyti TaxID=708187 RepID=A0A1Q8RRC0_9PEZI|nr:SGT1-like protein A [Colletotrichum chlorophyti]
MSEYTAGQAGITAVENKNWEEAITKLSQALKSTKSPKWLIARSKAYIGTKDFTRALRDAELAHAAAAQRGNRALVLDAQYRRAVAHFRLGQLADADACATWAQRMCEGRSMSDPSWREAQTDERGFATATRKALTDEITAVRQTEDPAHSKYGAMWNSVCALRLQILGGLEKLAEDDEKRKVSVKFAPDVSLDAADEEDDERLTKEEVKAAVAEATKKPEPVQKDVRVDFFQSNATMSVTVFAKNVPKDEFKVEYGSQEIRMTHIPGHEPEYTILLWGQIDPAGSKHTVTANKIEFQLKKLDAGKWPTLRRDPSSTASAPKPAAAAAAAAPAPAPPKQSSSSGPAYPTSSKSGPKNWDKLEGADDEDERDINTFFKQLYKGATPEQQRAMMKSFTESNGTSLSTDWDDVKGRKVETVPPEGVEAKKWES